jgi:3',5'-cyclic AMP phosphodiesterase CpdA
MKFNYLIVLLLIAELSFAQKILIPGSHSNIKQSGDILVVMVDTIEVSNVEYTNPLTLANIRGKIAGTGTGLYFDFSDESFAGTLVFGLVPYNDSKHPQPVYYARSASVKSGKVAINIANQLSGTYDMVGWGKTGKGTLGYRLITSNGRILFDGHISFKGTGPFEVDNTITEGPFINLLVADGATISFETNNMLKASVKINDLIFTDSDTTTHHEIKVDGLAPDTKYDYTVTYGENSIAYSFKTAPLPGSRSKFTFAYASDSRSGNGGGERNIYGANAYIVKKIMALATQQEVTFMQFTGDLINGYLTSGQEMDLQYANWKHTVEPFAHYFPVVATMGNHESLMRMFSDDTHSFMIDRFPYETESGEAAFARNFVNPLNGPESEDGASYDPNKRKTDFPSYKETVFYYTYDNVAVVVMNSDYWYSPSSSGIPITSGGLHGYIMDQQLAWLEETINNLEADVNVDHIFVTQHTPCFPNGGHVRDDMWYGGNNDMRPYVAGKPLEKGIIERRDQILDLLINKSQKTRAILTGDEHNFAKTEIGPNTIIYDEKWALPKLELTRTIYQINNGAAGAPYYAQEKTPWSGSVTGFTTQNALVLFHVDGDKIDMEVLNPDTLEKVDELKLK